MSEALERIVQYARNESDVGHSAMYFGSFGGPKNFSMGPAGMRGPSFGAGGGYGPVSRMDMSPMRNALRDDPYGVKATLPSFCQTPLKEQFSVYPLGSTELHVHQSGFGSIKEGRNTLYKLDRYETAMAEHDLRNEVEKLIRFCNVEKPYWEK